MSYFKDFGIPLTPFTIDLCTRLTLLDDLPWWKYVDATTLFLTPSLWALLMLPQLIAKPSIPTDTAARDELVNIRNTLLIIGIVGMAFFGLITFVKTILEALPHLQLQETSITPLKSLLEEKALFSLTIASISLFAITIIIVILNHQKIRN